MEPKNRYDGLSTRVVRNIRFKAKRLARQRAIPGMDAEDIEQDLILDLLQRQKQYDPGRASFETFAERIINHRIATLTSPTLRLRTERASVSIDAVITQDDEDAELSIGDITPMSAGLYADGNLDVESQLALEQDVSRFRDALPSNLRRYADILGVLNVCEAARIARVHRTTIYARLAEMRTAAIAAGLQQYIGPDPTLRHARW